MPYALCPMPYALCPVVPHLSEKGYIERYKAEVEAKQPLLESAELTSLGTTASEVKAAEMTAN